MESIFKELIRITNEVNAAQTKKDIDHLDTFIKKFDKTFCRMAKRAAKKGQSSVTIYVPCLTVAQLGTINKFYTAQGYVVYDHNVPFNEAEAKRINGKLYYPITFVWKEKKI